MGFRTEILVVYRKQPVTLRVRRQRQQSDDLAMFVTLETLNGKGYYIVNVRYGNIGNVENIQIRFWKFTRKNQWVLV